MGVPGRQNSAFNSVVGSDEPPGWVRLPCIRATSFVPYSPYSYSFLMTRPVSVPLAGTPDRSSLAYAEYLRKGMKPWLLKHQNRNQGHVPFVLCTMRPVGLLKGEQADELIHREFGLDLK